MSDDKKWSNGDIEAMAEACEADGDFAESAMLFDYLKMRREREQAEPVAHIVERKPGVNGYGNVKTVALVENYDPSDPSFWASESAQQKYIVTPLYTHPAQQASVPDAIGKAFVPGLGWVVQCSRAHEYVLSFLATRLAPAGDARGAERYRWLRNSDRIPEGDDMDGHIVVTDETGEDVLWGESLDRTIDTAIARSEECDDG